jgi:2-keto-4-pentenoate hydratase
MTNAHTKTPEMVIALFKARSIPEPIPPLTHSYGQISIEQAYIIQDQLAEKLCRVLGSVRGYKIGYASESAINNAGLVEPAYGRLYNDQIIESGSTISVDAFFLFQIEAEVAFKVGKPIDKHIESLHELKNYIQSVHASLDLPNGWFDQSVGKQTPSDFIANSGGSHFFVLGPPKDPNSINLDELELKILHDGQNIYDGPTTSLSGGPWNIMKLIANHELKRGYPLQPGYIILTGKVAPAFKAAGEEAKGTFVGDCGELGKIIVTLK